MAPGGFGARPNVSRAKALNSISIRQQGDSNDGMFEKVKKSLFSLGQDVQEKKPISE